MIEVTISFGNENGDGLRSLTVDVEAPKYFHTDTYWTAIRAAMLRFADEEPSAVITDIRLRSVSRDIIRL